MNKIVNGAISTKEETTGLFNLTTFTNCHRKFDGNMLFPECQTTKANQDSKLTHEVPPVTNPVESIKVKNQLRNKKHV
jgi:hypothetical protein